MRISYLLSKFIKKLHIPAITNSFLDKTSHICSGAHIVNTKIGKYSYVGNFSTLICCEVGSYCSIADNCEIGGGSHPTTRVSTSPVFYSKKNVLKKTFPNTKKYDEFKQTRIGNDVWIGSKCMIKGGVTIGTGAVIGMGSVVTHDVPPYEIWAGNPAKCIKKRFDDLTTQNLLDSQWWNLSEKELSGLTGYFDDPQKFLSMVKK